MNIAPTKKCNIKKSDGKPLVQSGKKSNVEKEWILHLQKNVVLRNQRENRYSNLERRVMLKKNYTYELN